MATAVLSLVLAVGQQGWTLQHARSVLAASTFEITDTSQPDRPRYELVFSRRGAQALNRRFGFAGIAHDTFTDQDIPVRFTFRAPGEIVAFRGPAADASQPTLPIRATFYYAWYPEAWLREPYIPYSRFHPSLYYYSAADAGVVRTHIDAMRYAHLDAALYSWFGRDGYPPTDERFSRYLAASRTTPFRWAIYHEWEGYSNPSVERIRADLEYIRDRYASQPAYLRISGRFVVFVYGNGEENCDTIGRWQEANTVKAYLVLKVFPGYRSCLQEPDAWHEYSATRAVHGVPPDSFMIAPGFDERGSAGPVLERDPARWREDIAAMVASNAPWQLVLTFNEWPEGTSVESATEWTTPSGYGEYLDALHDLVPR